MVVHAACVFLNNQLLSILQWIELMAVKWTQAIPVQGSLVSWLQFDLYTKKIVHCYIVEPLLLG